MRDGRKEKVGKEVQQERGMEQRRQMRREYSRDQGLKRGRRGKWSTTETRDEK